MSKQKRRKFSPEFKAGAVEMATQPGVAISHVARDLDVREGSLHEWMKKARGEAARPLKPSSPTGETEREELVRLRREVTRLRMERDFLKKTTAFFVRESH